MRRICLSQKHQFCFWESERCSFGIVFAGLLIWMNTRYASRCYRRHRLNNTGRYFPTMRRKHATCCWLASFVSDCRNTACCVLPCTRATWFRRASRGTGGCGESSSL